MNCGNCGFPLPENHNGCRHFGTSIAHQEYECVNLLQREIAALREAVLWLNDNALSFPRIPDHVLARVIQSRRVLGQSRRVLGMKP